MKITLLVLSSCIIIATCQNTNPCPPLEDIKPCTCLQNVITCDSLNSVDELTEAVAKMKDYSVSEFNLKYSNIGILPSDAFLGVAISSLRIVGSNISRLGDSRNRPPFVGLEDSLQMLQIIDSDSNMSLATLSLSHLKKLNLLLLNGNLIPTIGNNWFENGPYGLKQLTISNTQTSVIGTHAFEALENLEYFTLNGILTPEITREMLPMPANSLRSLNLRNNKLRTLPPDFFSKMPSLEQILLENNYFTKIDEATFALVWNQLEYAYFQGNPIICNNDLKWMYNYRLPEYFGGYCTSPPKLLHKDLRDLKISDFE